MRILIILFLSIIVVAFARKKINDKYEFIHYILSLTYFVMIILFLYILTMHFLGNSI
jgi:hypothetical protein